MQRRNVLGVRRPRAGVRVAFAGPAGVGSDPALDLIDQVHLESFHGRHLLSRSRHAVKMVALCPSQSAGVVWSAALLRDGLGGCAQFGHEQAAGERRDLDRGSYPACEVGFERPLVIITGLGRFAADFAHHVGVVRVEYVYASNDFFNAGLPGVRLPGARLLGLYLDISNNPNEV